jgi:hypothetical protein
MRANHLYIFLNALRTACLIVAGVVAYDILKEIELLYYKENPNNKTFHFVKHKFYNLLIIFILDLLLLYFVLFAFNIEL